MMTGALYFQVDIFKLNEWPLSYIAVAIFCYALFKFLNTIFIGPIIDRFGVVFPLFLLTAAIGIATIMISFNGPPLIGFIYYALYGVGLGASASTMSYLWGLLYGSDHIGEIKGLLPLFVMGQQPLPPLAFLTLFIVLACL